MAFPPRGIIKLALIVICFANLINSQNIVLYEHAGFEGGRLPITLKGTNCINLPDWANDWASSIDTRGACVELCEHINCNGRCDQFLPRSSHHNALQTINFNDAVTSLRGCRYRRRR